MAALPKKFMKSFAKQLIDIIDIKKKPNIEGIKKAKKKYRWITKLIKLKSFNLKQAVKKTKKPEDVVKKVLEELQHPKYGPFIVKIGNRYQVKTEVGETIVLRFHPEYREFAEELAKLCFRRGAHPMISIRTVDDILRKYQNSPVDACAEAPEPFLSLNNKTDVVLTSTLETESWARLVKPSKMKVSSPASEWSRDIAEKYGQRWALIGLPFKETAKEYGVPFSKLRMVMLRSLKESFSDGNKKIIDYYAKKLSNKKNQGNLQ